MIASFHRCHLRSLLIAAFSLPISPVVAQIRPKHGEDDNLGFVSNAARPKQHPNDTPFRHGELDMSSLDGEFNEQSEFDVQFFFDEPHMTFHKKNTTKEGWFGEDDVHGNSFNLFNSNGKFHGSVNYDDKIYSIKTLPNGDTEVEEINSADLPPEDADHEGWLQPLIEQDVNEMSSTWIPPDYRRLDLHDSGDEIDIMCIYTFNAMCAEAGFGNTNTCANTRDNREPMDNRCKLAVEETNFAYAESGVETKLRLVHSAPIDREDLRARGILNLLNQMTSPSDGLMDDLLVWRKQHRADLVVLITENRHFCGIGWSYNGDPSSGFSVVHRRCMTGYYSFGHEIGHNLGCTHDRKNKGHEDVKYYPGDGYGYQDPQYSFRTIMAYDCPGGCTKVQRFSNTKSTVMFEGKPLPAGTEHDNCAHRINESRTQVANYMKSLSADGKQKVEQVPEPTFMGCYNEAEDKALEIFAGDDMNVEQCREVCTNLGTSVFGLEDKACWCGTYGYEDINKAEDCQCEGEDGTSEILTFCAYEINRFEGCYLDQNDRSLNYFAGKEMNFLECRNTCKEKGYHFMGREGKHECWCGGSSPTDIAHLTHGSSSKCRCNERHDLRGYRMCVYRIPYASFKGCWKDGIEYRAFSRYVGEHLSQDQCFGECERLGYHFMGRKGWEECWCTGSSPDDFSYQAYGRDIGCGCGSQFIGNQKFCVHQIPRRV